MHCFYHNDLDGHCAGAIVKMKYPECHMHEIQYGYDFNTDVLLEIDEAVNLQTEVDKRIIIVDFSFFTDEITWLVNKLGYKVIWIDHHATAIGNEKLEFVNAKAHNREDIYSVVDGIRDVSKSGCELTWEYLYPDTPMPRAVHWLGRWDVWDHSDINTIPFHAGMDLMHTDPIDPEVMESWIQVLEDKPNPNPNSAGNLVDLILGMGNTANKAKEKYDIKICKNAYYLTDWQGYRTVAVNGYLQDSYAISKDDERFSEFKPEVLVWYCQTPDNKWIYSLRSYPGTETDVSTIATKFGGGGHAGASGFKNNKLIITPETDNV